MSLLLLLLRLLFHRVIAAFTLLTELGCNDEGDLAPLLLRHRGKVVTDAPLSPRRVVVELLRWGGSHSAVVSVEVVGLVTDQEADMVHLELVHALVEADHDDGRWDCRRGVTGARDEEAGDAFVVEVGLKLLGNIVRRHQDDGAFPSGEATRGGESGDARLSHPGGRLETVDAPGGKPQGGFDDLFLQL